MSAYEVVKAMRDKASKQEHYCVVKSGARQVALLSVKVRRAGKALIRRDLWKVDGKRASLYQAMDALSKAANNPRLPKQILCTHEIWLGHSGTGAVFCAACSMRMDDPTCF